MDVIVKAFGLEPIKMKEVARQGNHIEVMRDNPSMTILLRSVWVRKFDKELFAQLRSAFEKKETDALIALWDKTVPA